MSDYGTVWREFEANEITHSGAHYLLAVASFVKNGASARAADVARHLGVSRAAASLQLRALKDNGWVSADDSHHLHLTREGAEMVARISSKRRAFELFLHRVLGVDEEIARMDACKVEHLISEETGAGLVRLTRFLGSGHPAAAAALAAFAEFTSSCTTESADDLCVEPCMVAMGEPKD